MGSSTDRLKVLFDEIGGYRRAIEDGMPFTTARPQMYDRLLEAAVLLPPGNGHIWNDYRMWVMKGWAAAMSSGGDAAAEPWREFLGEIGELLGPVPD